MSSSISALTTPEASVPGMSQCSQPWRVGNEGHRVLGAADHEAFGSSSASMSGSTLLSSSTMNSILLRMVKAHVTVGILVADVAQLSQREHVQDALGPGLHGPDFITALGHVTENAPSGGYGDLH